MINAGIVAGVYNLIRPSLIDGQSCAIQEDVNGNVTTNIIVNQGGAEVPTSGHTGQGNSARPTSGQLVSGTYNSSAPVLSDGQSASVQTDLNGNLKLNVVIEA